MADHQIATTHIQRLIRNALDLAEAVHGERAGTRIPLPEEVYAPPVPAAGEWLGAPVDHMLAKAAADLRHAAEELDAERLSCFGWRQA